MRRFTLYFTTALLVLTLTGFCPAETVPCNPKEQTFATKKRLIIIDWVDDTYDRGDYYEVNVYHRGSLIYASKAECCSASIELDANLTGFILIEVRKFSHSDGRDFITTGDIVAREGIVLYTGSLEEQFMLSPE